MKITLDANPADAPCCIKVCTEDGRSLLIQTDLDYPDTASAFGFSVGNVVNADNPGCMHMSTDGTVDCPECGLSAGTFIAAARTWLDAHDGAKADDPGYFPVEVSP